MILNFRFQKFLIKVPNGMFGSALEEELLEVLEMEDPGEQFETINRCRSHSSCPPTQTIFFKLLLHFCSSCGLAPSSYT